MADLTIEQLRELIKLKEAQLAVQQGASSTATATVSTSTAKSADAPCVFKPIKANQPPCTEESIVMYGPNGYCRKHSRTVQALNAKRVWEESNAPAVVAALTPVSVPPPVMSTPVQEPKPVESAPDDTDMERIPTPEPEVVSKPSKRDAAKRAPEPEVVKTKRKIRPNRWGRFEDEETGIIFDPRSKAAYGVQDHTTGKVLALTKKDIKICESYGWRHVDLKKLEEESDSEEGSGDEDKDAEPAPVSKGRGVESKRVASKVEAKESSDDDEDDDEEDDEDEDGEDDEEASDDEDEEEEDEEDEEDEEEEDDEDGDEEEEDEEDDEDGDDEEEDDSEDDEPPPKPKAKTPISYSIGRRSR